MGIGKARTGLNPLTYVGINSDAPPPLVIQKRIPTADEALKYPVGTLWLMVDQEEIWMDVMQPTGATWVKIYPGGGSGSSADFICDRGHATAAGSELNMFGGSNINTDGAGSTVTVALNTAVNIGGNATVGNDVTAGGAITSGSTDIGTGAMDITDEVTFEDVPDGILTANSAAVVGKINQDADDGQTLISKLGGNPKFANLTSSDGSVDITNGPNSIDLKVEGGASGDFAFMYTGGGGTYTKVNSFVDLGSVGAFTKVYDPEDVLYPGDGTGIDSTGAYFTAPEDGIYFFGGCVTMAYMMLPVKPWDTEWPTGVAFRFPTRTIYCRRYLVVAADYYSSDAFGPSTVIYKLNNGDKVYFSLATAGLKNGEVTVDGAHSWIYGYKVN